MTKLQWSDMCKRLFIILIIAELSITGSISTGQDVGVGFGVNVTPGAGKKAKPKSKKKQELKDAFIERIAIRLDQDPDELHSLRRKGYGRVELIKLILIAKKTKQPLNEIVKLRNRKEKIKKIAEKYNLDYKKIYFQAKKIKLEIKREEGKFFKPLKTGTTTILINQTTTYKPLINQTTTNAQ